jgi:hypothetical protein
LANTKWEARVQGVYRACATYQTLSVPAKLERRPLAVHARFVLRVIAPLSLCRLFAFPFVA